MSSTVTADSNSALMINVVPTSTRKDAAPKTRSNLIADAERRVRERIADFIGEHTARAVWGSLDDVRVVTC